jgi:hypothetical protein
MARSGSRTRPACRSARDGLRPRTGLGLIAIGLVLLLAVHVHTAAVNPQNAGLIVTALGLTWLWAPVSGKRAALGRLVQRALRYLCWDGADPAMQSTLADLLDDAGHKPS